MLNRTPNFELCDSNFELFVSLIKTDPKRSMSVSMKYKPRKQQTSVSKNYDKRKLKHEA